MTDDYRGGAGKERVGRRREAPDATPAAGVRVSAAVRAAEEALTRVVRLGAELRAVAAGNESLKRQELIARRTAAEAEFTRARAVATNRGAQRLVELRSAATDSASVLLGGRTRPRWSNAEAFDLAGQLEAATFVEIGSVVADGRVTGVSNENITVPAVIPLLDHGNVVIVADGDDVRVGAVLNQILLESLVATGPGQLSIESFDPLLRATVAPFVGLRSAADELLPASRSTGRDLDELLAALTADVQRIRELTRGTNTTLGEVRCAAGMPLERYQIVVIRDFPYGWTDEQVRRLKALAPMAASCGISLVVNYDPARPESTDESLDDLWVSAAMIDLGTETARLGAVRGYTLALAESPSAHVLERTVERIASAATSAVAPRISFSELHRGVKPWSESSADGITATIGRAGLDPVVLRLGDERTQRHNVLVSGAVGQGKSNLLMAIVHSLAWRYGPDQLRMYLLDLKEGLTLHPLAPHPPSQPEYLPHAEVLGLEGDPAFARSVLEEIVGEFEHRARTFKSSGDNISRYRRANPDAPMPRLLVVIDEFHRLFSGDPGDTSAAIDALERLAREGRAYGIHLVLASQTISGITALLTRQDGIFSQFPVRLALKNSAVESRVVLDQQNPEAARLRFRGEVIINEDFGSLEANHRAVVVDANPGELAALRHEWWSAAGALAPPRVFDGSSPARIEDSTGALVGLRLRALNGGSERIAVIGKEVSSFGNLVGASLSASSGSHLAVIGTGVDRPRRSTMAPVGDLTEALSRDLAVGSILAAATSLAMQHPSDQVDFVVLDMLDVQHRGAVWLDETLELITDFGHSVEVVPADRVATTVSGFEQSIAARSHTSRPMYVIGLGLDRANLTMHSGFGKPADGLQTLVHHGPATHAHLLGWWSTEKAFSDTIGFGAANAVRSVLLLGVQRSDVTALLGPFVTWASAENRGLFRSGGGVPPVVVVPMRPISPTGAEALRDVVRP